MKLTVNVNTQKLQQQIKKAQQEINKNLPVITAKGANAFADNAMKYVPPKIGGTFSKTIPSKAYKRQIVNIRKELERLQKIRGKAKRKKDEKTIKKSRLFQQKIIKYADALNAGYKYAIRGVQNFKKKTFFYKTSQIAKKFTRIANRGLMKIMFGAGLYTLNEVPKSIGRLLEKSPNLKKFVNQLNPIHQMNKKDESKLTMENKAGNISESLANIAMRQGRNKARKQIIKQAKDIVRNTITKELK